MAAAVSSQEVSMASILLGADIDICYIWYNTIGSMKECTVLRARAIVIV